MKQVFLNHSYESNRQALGVLTTDDGLFTCKTLELAYKDNQSNISRIPTFSYLCKWTRSPRLSRESLLRWIKKNPDISPRNCPSDLKNVYTYEIMNVPNRAGIRIHAANYFFQLLGCIALGSALKDINMDQELDVIHSGDTLRRFHAHMDKEPFMLHITDNFNVIA